MNILHITFDGKYIHLWIEDRVTNKLGFSNNEEVKKFMKRISTHFDVSSVKVLFPFQHSSQLLLPYTTSTERNPIEILTAKIELEDLLRLFSKRRRLKYSTSTLFWLNVITLTLELLKKRRGIYPKFENNNLIWEIPESLLHKILRLFPFDALTFDKLGEKEEAIKRFINLVVDHVAESTLNENDYKLLSENAFSSYSAYTLYFIVKPTDQGFKVTLGLYDLNNNRMIPYGISVYRKEFEKLVRELYANSDIERYMPVPKPFEIHYRDNDWLEGFLRAVSHYKVFFKNTTQFKPKIKIERLNILSNEDVADFDYKIAIGNIELTPEEFEKLVSENKPYLEVSGKLIEIDPKDLNKIKRVLEKLKKKDVEKNELLREALEGYIESQYFEELLKNIENQRFSLFSPPKLNVTLRPYQVKGFSWMKFMTSLGFGVVLADDMGLGKTIQTLATIAKTKEEGEEIFPSLIVCPTSVLRNWEEEIAKYAPNLSYALVYGKSEKENQSKDPLSLLVETYGKKDIYITTYNTLPLKDYLLKVNWKFIVLDEAQFIKNAETKRSRTIRKLRGKYRIALTGTPIENSINDLWPIMSFLNPGLLGSREEFKENYADPIKKGDKDAKEALKKIISPFILRRTKTDKNVISDLPDKIEINEYCTLTEEQASLYQAVVDDFLEKIDELKGIERKRSILAAITKLKEIVDHPALIKKDNDFSVERSGKLERLLEIVEEAVEEGDKVAIFTQFLDMGEILTHNLRKYGAVFFHGSLSKQERDKVLHEFQNNDDIKVIILSLRAGGFGINLTSANRVIHYDRWWNPAVENQATDRTYRIGQNRNVIVHKLITQGTIEEKIDEIITSKITLYNELITEGEQILTELSTDQLKEILRLR